MKIIKRIITFIVVITMMVAMVNPVTADAATKVKLNKTKATLTITDSKKNPTATLKVKGTSKKAKWSTSDKNVATVKNGKVTAKKAGKATITCKVNGKKLTCKVTVKDKRTPLEVTLQYTELGYKDSWWEIVSDGCIFHDRTDEWDRQYRLVVKYKGKDVTKKVECWSDYNDDDSGNAFVNGVLDIFGSGYFDVHVAYNGMETAVRLKTQVTRKYYNQCICNAIFDDDASLEAHMDASAEAWRRGETDTFCGQWMIVYYKSVRAAIVR